MEKGHLEIILEDMNGKFALILESHQVLRNDINRTRVDLLEKIEDNSLAINGLDKKVDRINKDLGCKIETLDSKVDKINGDLNAKIDKLDSSLNAKIDKLDSSLNAKIDRVRDELGAKIDAVSVDLKCHRGDTEIHTNYRVSEGRN